MTPHHRQDLYNLWLQLIDDSKKAKETAKTHHERGDALFEGLKSTDVDTAYAAADLDWQLTDVYNDFATELEQQIKSCYDRLCQEHLDLSEYESCAQIGHAEYKRHRNS